MITYLIPITQTSHTHLPHIPTTHTDPSPLTYSIHSSKHTHHIYLLHQPSYLSITYNSHTLTILYTPIYISHTYETHSYCTHFLHIFIILYSTNTCHTYLAHIFNTLHTTYLSHQYHDHHTPLSVSRTNLSTPTPQTYLLHTYTHTCYIHL
jgi:hypothetical protein